MYTGNESIYTYTFEHQQKPECPVCGGEAIEVSRPAESTLQDLIDFLLEKQDVCVTRFRLDRAAADPTCAWPNHRQIRRPSISFGPKNLYLQAPPQLEQATRPNLEKTLQELMTSGDVLTVTDAGLPFSLNLSVKFA